MTPIELEFAAIESQDLQNISLEFLILPSQVSAPDHFGYCTVTPDVEVTEGFYNFSAAQLKAFSERFKGQESIDGLLMSKFLQNFSL